ncbi:MAG: YggS family pyridoxal phosphate-dependent enzyme [Acidobacteriia bacterium]|nr:YggS family pyridoxal phosphate-dependent enzyme [Terriglobia bacterium]
MSVQEIRDNIGRIEERIQRACQRAGRDRHEVQLIAVSKTFPAEAVLAAVHAGLSVFAENRVQEADQKFSALVPALALEDHGPGEGAAGRKLKLHLIGHLQSNKAKRAAEIFDMIQTVDRIELALKLSRSCEQLNRLLSVLIQVNLGNEETKSGVEPSGALELVRQVSELKALRVRGLMVIPPFRDRPEESRADFRSMRQLAGEIAKPRMANVSMHELSMGMSHDFEVAIEEGATMIRIGTAIFGGRG